MKRLIALLIACAVNGAWACGVCIDDKVASCYDHAVVTKARAQGHEVAFFAIQGPLAQDAATRARVEQVVAGTPGVLRGTARVSVENAALSFAYDPRRSSAMAIAQAMQRRLAEPSLSLALLRVMN